MDYALDIKNTNAKMTSSRAETFVIVVIFLVNFEQMTWSNVPFAAFDEHIPVDSELVRNK